MDYYEKYKPEAVKAVAASLANLTKLREQLANGRKRLADEQSRIERLESHREKLTADAAESLADNDPRQYDKYQTALKSNNDEIERRSPAVKQLKDTLLPALQEKLSDARSSFDSALEQFGHTSALSVRETEINKNLATIGELFAACETINQDFLEAFVRIYDDFGATARFTSGEVGATTDSLRFHPKPFPWPTDLIEQLRIKLGMGGLSDKTQRAIEAVKEKKRIEDINKEQLATAGPAQEAPVSHPTVEQGS